MANKLSKCHEAVHLVYQMEKKLYDDNIISLGGNETSNEDTNKDTYSNKSLIQLEATVLNMASTPSLCQGVLYIFPVMLTDYIIVRYDR